MKKMTTSQLLTISSVMSSEQVNLINRLEKKPVNMQALTYRYNQIIEIQKKLDAEIQKRREKGDIS